MEYIEDEQLSTLTVSTYVANNDVIPFNHGIDPLGNIPFENVAISDLAESATPAEMHSATLHHLRMGKPFFLYSHGPSPEPDYYNTNLFPLLYPTLYPFGIRGFEDTHCHPAISMKAHARHLLNIKDGWF